VDSTLQGLANLSAVICRKTDETDVAARPSFGLEGAHLDRALAGG
jgi:hypothetical protein